ncbi:MAG: hypothetical protein KatS3mg131_0721 [Candidatus Tectimicrobiota bacterium]|nr:MAG: hypothetical protein KatS3mg131_0721 [Candidatus Tectomicrobia bacterium]
MRQTTRRWHGIGLGVLLVLGVLVPRGEGKTTLSGFVDTSFFYESLLDTNTFSLDEVELDVDSALTSWAALRADLNLRAVDSGEVNTDVLGVTVISFDDLSADDLLEQGYVSLVLPTRRLGLPFDATFRFGKFNAPIGWELLDPVDMYQFSHALVFNFGLPTNLTGALLALAFRPAVEVQLYAVNGWDLLNDNNKMKTFGGRLGLTPFKGVQVGLSLISGPERPDNEDDFRTVVDGDLTLTLVPRLLIGAEFNYGIEENAAADGGDATWVGGLLTLHYRVTEVLGATLRFDVFADHDATRLPNANPAVDSQTAYAVTFAPTFALAKGAALIVEFRYDKSDADVFQKASGRFTDQVFSAAVEFTYAFSHTFNQRP